MRKTVQVCVGGVNPPQKFDTDAEFEIGAYVIVETPNGAEWGVAASKPATAHGQSNNLVIRTATRTDEVMIKTLRAQAENAFDVAKEKIAKHNLEMKLLNAHYTLDGGKVILQFYSENRVDFRELVKDLAFALRARVELRQVGARDEVKITGAMGECGMQCCCGRFIENFDNVTIKMAKNQNISLNPQRINGMCGRLLCCLAYENEHYAKMQQKMPRFGSEVQTPEGKGVAQDNNMLKETVNVKLQNGDGANFKCFKLCDIKCRDCNGGRQ